MGGGRTGSRCTCSGPLAYSTITRHADAATSVGPIRGQRAMARARPIDASTPSISCTRMREAGRRPQRAQRA